MRAFLYLTNAWVLLFTSFASAKTIELGCDHDRNNLFAAPPSWKEIAWDFIIDINNQTA